MSFRNEEEIDKMIKAAVDAKVKKALDKGIDMSFADAQKLKIVRRTQLGIGVDERGEAYRLPPLSDSYKEQRRGEARWITLKDGRKVKIGGKAKKPEGLSKPDVPASTRKKRKKRGQGILKKLLKKKNPRKKKPQKRLRNLAATTTPGKSNLTATGQLLKSLTTVKMKMEGGVRWIIRIGDNRGRNLMGDSSKIGNRKLADILEAQGRRFFGFTKSQKKQMAREVRLILKKFLK